MARQGGAVAQEPLQDPALILGQVTRQIGEVDILRIDLDGRSDLLAQPAGKLLKTELGKGGGTAEDEHGR